MIKIIDGQIYAKQKGIRKPKLNFDNNMNLRVS